MGTYELLSVSETLAMKLELWQQRMKYAKGARRAECERAIRDLTAKLAKAGA